MRRYPRVFLQVVFTLVAGVVSASHSSDANAQPALISVPAGSDLRAVYANAADVAEGKRVAESACIGCHGAGGISVTKGVPHLAAQRAAYLNIELRAYRSGARGDDSMRNAVRDLNDDALYKVAAYYGSVDPAPPAASDAAKATAARPDPVQAGKAATATCAGCHGEGGVGKIPGMPSLAGLDPKYLGAAMKAYKSGQRKNDVMALALARATDADIDNMALYYALQKPVRTENPAPGDQAAGKAAAAACGGCHGEQGISENPAIPSLAGQDAQYFVASLRDYKEGSRHDEPMKGLVAQLDDATIKNMAAWYATQQPQPAKIRKPLATAEWAQRCDRCHGVDGNSTDPRMPALAGQRFDYLQNVLHAYRTGARASLQMAAMSDVLTEADVENLAAHYARQKSRAVVYVIVPSK
jgi:cytochrome c553